MSNSERHFIAADIGNSTIKFGLYSSTAAQTGSQNWPTSWTATWTGNVDELELKSDVLPSEPADWWICSVSQPGLEGLQTWVKANRPSDTVRSINCSDIPLQIDVEAPEQVGVDRLVAAYMASILYPDKDLVVVDAGTAVTVDAVANQKFLGGTISPGSRIEFEALLNQADQLPLIEGQKLPEKVIGKSTAAAIRSGVLFGQIGSITFLAAEIGKQLKAPQIVATGGGAIALQERLPDEWDFVPTLVLDGIRAIAVRSEK